MTTDSDGRWRLGVKELADRAGAALLLIIFLPVLLVLAVLVLASSSDRRIFFRQRRVGHGGREFVLLKFKTMERDPALEGEANAAWAAAAVGAPPPPVRAERLTAVGAFLRRSRLDELPQLVNVLRGDMSLVGPRPELPTYVDLFVAAIPGYCDRTRAKPGITGLAQVNGLVGTTSIRARTELDNLYIETWSLWLDLRILLQTIPAVLLDLDVDTVEEHIGAPALLLEDGGVRP